MPSCGQGESLRDLTRDADMKSVPSCGQGVEVRAESYVTRAFSQCNVGMTVSRVHYTWPMRVPRVLRERRGVTAVPGMAQDLPMNRFANQVNPNIRTLPTIDETRKMVNHMSPKPALSFPRLFNTSRAAIARLSRKQVIFDHPDPEPIVGSIAMPFATGRNPHTDAVAVANAQWIVDLGLLEAYTPAFHKFGAARFEELAGLVYRDEDFDSLLLAANYITALFFLDDMVDAAGSRVGAEPALVRQMARFMSECVRTGWAPIELSASEWSLPSADRTKLLSIGRALADVTRRLVALPNQPDLRHYWIEMDEYLAGVVAEAKYRQTQRFAGVADYEAVRTKFSAMYACLEFGMLLRGLNPSSKVRCYEPYRRMVRNTNLCVSYVNDLFSYRKEFLLGECSNLVMVLERTNGFNRAAAFQEGCRISDFVLLDYMDNKQRCLQLDDADARASISQMETWMRGNYDWYVGRTFRYVDTLSTHERAKRHERVRPDANKDGWMENVVTAA